MASVKLLTCPDCGLYAASLVFCPICNKAGKAPQKATKAATGKARGKTAKKAHFEAWEAAGVEKVEVSSRAKNLQGEWEIYRRWGLRVGGEIILEASHEETIERAMKRYA